MLNNVMLAGRLTKDPELKQTENGKKYTKITLAVQRPYKNSEGKYDTDFIDCYLWENVASNTCEYCHKGDIVGVRGRLETNIDKEEKMHLNIISERITFLSSRSSKEHDHER